MTKVTETDSFKKVIDTKFSGSRPVNRTITFPTTTWEPPIDYCKCRDVTEELFDKAEEFIQKSEHSSSFFPRLEQCRFSQAICSIFENYVKGGFMVETGEFVEISRYKYSKDLSEGKTESHLTFRVYLDCKEDDNYRIERLLIATVDYSVEVDYGDRNII